MNDKITISTAELFRMFPDQETARTYLESFSFHKPLDRCATPRAELHLPVNAGTLRQEAE